MHDVLHPLTLLPGVRLAAVISGDGVPVCVLERSSSGADEFVDCTTSSQPSLEGQRIDPASLVALAASWVDDLMRAGGQIAWEVPKRFVLVASQGTLVVQQGPNAHVMVVLETIVAPEDFVLPLEAAVERLHRLLRDLGRFDPDQNAPALPRHRVVAARHGHVRAPVRRDLVRPVVVHPDHPAVRASGVRSHLPVMLKHVQTRLLVVHRPCDIPV